MPNGYFGEGNWHAGWRMIRNGEAAAELGRAANNLIYGPLPVGAALADLRVRVQRSQHAVSTLATVVSMTGLPGASQRAAQLRRVIPLFSAH